MLVARGRQCLEALADALVAEGASAHVITADLSDIDAVPKLAASIRAAVGDLDALYYAPAGDAGFVPATDLTPERALAFMPLTKTGRELLDRGAYLIDDCERRFLSVLNDSDARQLRRALYAVMATDR